MSRAINPNVPRTVQYNEHPVNTPLKGRFPGMKYYKQGIILEMGRFYYIDSKGKQTFRQVSPGFEVLDESASD